jgi:hypothetical protein
VACPCGASNLALPVDDERCQALLAFHVDSGEIDGVEISDTNVALFADTRNRMSDRGWRLGAFLDAAAFEEQSETTKPSKPNSPLRMSSSSSS